MNIYVYNKDLTSVDPSKLGKVAKGLLAFPKDREKREIEYNLVEDRYELDIPGINKVHRYDLHVNITIGEETVLGDFGVDNIR